MSTHAVLAIIAAVIYSGTLNVSGRVSTEQAVFTAREILAEVEKQTKVR